MFFVTELTINPNVFNESIYSPPHFSEPSLVYLMYKNISRRRANGQLLMKWKWKLKLTMWNCKTKKQTTVVTNDGYFFLNEYAIKYKCKAFKTPKRILLYLMYYLLYFYFLCIIIVFFYVIFSVEWVVAFTNLNNLWDVVVSLHFNRQ